ncbi:tRNA glutamyl-Q(34) synthetase GluQRS [Aliidiomarina halalkaliphila]|uniref:Glutamyl-Q tRNA(Asp) synthetase n=1 Tax=Aliidiomarina halalkaliphila TaxID=2593535 RepID=A0A552WZC2_9GAMM|nr:tRNA glutamyl-Q(34) synthetase GluQRS [Aliidiomarina halalkaliphila]TRW48170.1 tRNA glutamyl-Q(34) synthetase GluQRS [Aliidiomarina halalkaliphila]
MHQPFADSMKPRGYRGRFAPSPSGPLHAGSLVAALGSYLDAKAQQGLWFVRIEDIDPPREVPGAADTILGQLDAHGLHWDGDVSWQSQHSARYQDIIAQLQNAGLVYACHCTRAEIKQRGDHYDGFCRNRQQQVMQSSRRYALRFRNTQPITELHDRFHGSVPLALSMAKEDFILRRRDQLWAYQLAVVTDDRDAEISHIVRGEDLLVASGWQMTLWQQLNTLSADPVALPNLAHLPLVRDEQGQKLSKQNHAPALNNHQVIPNLVSACHYLGLHAIQEGDYNNTDTLLRAATEQWQQIHCK